MIIQTRAYPRAGLIGNPSDGYFGKTISFTFTEFCATVTLYQSPELEIVPHIRDHSRFKSVRTLVDDVNLYGYYGGIRLLKASIKAFVDYCTRGHIALDDRNFTIKYDSNIPHRVGLAGSSAIITACFRALSSFYQVEIPKPVLPNLILSVEKEELQISAGLQDRVAQVYEGVVYMDFDREKMKRQDHGRYEYLDPTLLPPLYIAYHTDLSEGSEIMHNNLRERFDVGEREVVDAMKSWISLTDIFKATLNEKNHTKLGKLIDENFDLRKSICQISSGNTEMIETARSTGATAKFTGSGGAIIGTYDSDKQYAQLASKLGSLGIEVIRPTIKIPD